IPYLSLAGGGVIVWMVLRRMRGHKPLRPAMAGHPGNPPDNDPVLARYRDAIERDTEKLD
ncbi:MAG: hypothetical protein M3N54_00655, partial [Acidobacteriota bacterium]|nr:hypothetical protein [Acidobacteriota bacterium]